MLSEDGFNNTKKFCRYLALPVTPTQIQNQMPVTKPFTEEKNSTKINKSDFTKKS